MLGHERGTLFFSGGKDSLACLLLLREHWDRITVAWVNPGAPHAETVAYMGRIRELVPCFVELKGQQPEWIAAHGWPVDVLPVNATSAGSLAAGEPAVKMQAYMTCCNRNLWEPIRRYIATEHPTLVIMGQRKDESLRNRLRDAEVTTVDGVTYWHPLHEWTADRAKDYIRAQGFDLPPFYGIGAESSPDCWNCTAYLDHNLTRLRWMRRERPEQFAIIEPVLRDLGHKLQEQSDTLRNILG